MEAERVKIAVNGGIGFGAKLNSKQLITLAKYLNEDETLEMTTFQQLYLEIEKDQKEDIIEELEGVGLSCYPVGNYVKSLRTCNFCKGELEEGMPVAKEINRRTAGIEVPFTLKMAYTGCPVGCGEPLINDIGIMKKKEEFSIFIGGKSKGEDAKAGHLLFEKLTPEALYAVIEQLIHLYNNQGKKREAFYKFVNRIGFENIKDSIEV
ncbi:nitrite reductase [Bacillus sp. 31A1R]|uniref:Nitrite reductase n=1 Tax=Robertmurraya mangrovi TaxID=3098077 RepID=A0ABU5J3E7_9BACI|nr:nitrite reductase [Bacillus sp. 31A1R]MDZ5473928.1 nitrite reductase [Bacillus sp. 31A1R]